MKKLIFIVIDGGADRPVQSLNGLTPFQMAETPNLDFLARNGINGIMQVLPIPPESDEAVLALLGFDVFKVYTGRGPLEAVGSGVPFRNGDLALRCNFATVLGNDILDIRAGNITTPEAKELEWAINEKVKLTNAEFEFRSTVDYRGSLIIKQNKEPRSAKISNTHPGYNLQYFETVWSKEGPSVGIPLSFANKVPIMKMISSIPLDRTKSSATSAALVNEFIQKSRFVLENHYVNKKRIANKKPPANILLTRNAGNKIPPLYNLTQVHGLRWACFADMPVERGICQLCGMQTIPLPELSAETAEANVAKDMYIRAATLIKNLQLYDAFYIHLKGPDPYAHRGDCIGLSLIHISEPTRPY